MRRRIAVIAAMLVPVSLILAGVGVIAARPWLFKAERSSATFGDGVD
jgi:hypothetical protein